MFIKNQLIRDYYVAVGILWETATSLGPLYYYKTLFPLTYFSEQDFPGTYIYKYTKIGCPYFVSFSQKVTFIFGYLNWGEKNLYPPILKCFSNKILFFPY